MARRTARVPVLGIFGHLTVEREGEAAAQYGRFTGEHEVYLGPLSVYWSAVSDRDHRRQIMLTLSSLHLPLVPYLYAKVDMLVKGEVDHE